MAVRWRASATGPFRQRWLHTPCGWLKIKSRGETLTGLAWAQGEPPNQTGAGLEAVICQLAAYFRHPDAAFEVELAVQGTPFCRRVWEALLAIPPGCTLTYGELAHRLGTSPRAAAAACRANPYPIVIPCHRVVAKGGLGGYCGSAKGPALAIKSWLLAHEHG